MKEGCEEVRVVDLKRKFDEDILVAEVRFLETSGMLGNSERRN